MASSVPNVDPALIAPDSVAINASARRAYALCFNFEMEVQPASSNTTHHVAPSDLDLPESQSSVYQPAEGPSSERPDSATEAQAQAELVADRARVALMNNTGGATQQVLEAHRRRSEVEGWCTSSTHATTHGTAGGYVQVSWRGANKVATLQEVLLWAKGEMIGVGEQASHLCHNTRCLNPAHVVAEAEVDNQRRKGCSVWVRCPHMGEAGCPGYVDACVHVPRCIKFCPGFADHSDFVARGLHRP